MYKYDGMTQNNTDSTAATPLTTEAAAIAPQAVPKDGQVAELAPALATQLAGLSLAPGRPLLVVDADEVLFYFMRGFERHLERMGLYFDWKSYALYGNIRRQDDNEPVPAEELHPLLDRFFATDTANLEPVEGAADGLRRLSAIADIVVLSNLPLHAKGARETALALHGMAYPLIANSGGKGPAMAALLQHAPRRAAFLDDIPHNHASVAKAAPMVHRVHFIADTRLAALLPPAEHSQHRAASWAEIEPYMAAYLAG